MNQDIRSHSDIAGQLNELSELAQLGRSNVVNIGPLVLMWGIAVAVAALLEGFSRSYRYTVVFWVVPLLLAQCGSMYLIHRLRAGDHAMTWRSRALHRIWTAAGAAIVVFNVGEELRRTGLQSESEAATALILAVAVLASAELSGRKALTFTGIGWMIVALAMFITATTQAFFLILAAASLLLQVMPGILLIRRG